MSSTSTLPSVNPVSLRQDAGVIGLVGLAHGVSHFSQLLLAPLFPWLKTEFNVGYAELGFLMTVFFVVSCVTQTLSGFVVDKFGPRPILFAGLGLLGLSAFGFSISTGYWMMASFSALAGIGNGVFHPVDYTLINKKVSQPRLGHAYSFHGITGSLGWALAPALVVPIALAYSWRHALMAAGTVAFAVLAVLWINRGKLALPMAAVAADARQAKALAVEGNFDFLRIPAVWMCFAFFFVYAIVISVVQAFAPEAARQLHGVPVAMAALCLTVYMVCSAGGMVLGGFLAADPSRCERVVGAGFGTAAVFALALGLFSVPAFVVPVLFGFMGFASGIAGPSRDLLVKKSTPENSTGRVYGVVYSGLDIGQAAAPLFFGTLMDHKQFSGVFLGLAVTQGLLIASAFRVRKTRRTALVAAAA
ncbi:MAG: MFS transporter [Comamonadaceae bacterium]|nr:MAG: MFS transporter [Comamonadaceae bacterium]